MPKLERESSKVMEGRDGVREDAELEDCREKGEFEDSREEGELEDIRDDADTEGEEKAEPSAEDCCWVLMLLFNPFLCISNIKRLTSFSDNCWPELD